MTNTPRPKRPRKATTTTPVTPDIAVQHSDPDDLSTTVTMTRAGWSTVAAAMDYTGRLAHALGDQALGNTIGIVTLDLLKCARLSGHAIVEEDYCRIAEALGHPEDRKRTLPVEGLSTVKLMHPEWLEIAMTMYRAHILESDPVAKKRLKKLSDRLVEAAARGTVGGWL